jgi:hypothetical protein
MRAVTVVVAVLLAVGPWAVAAVDRPTGETIRVEFVEATETADRDTGTWTFAGTVGGRRVQASGTGWYGPTTAEGDGCVAEVAIDRIRVWRVSGVPRPKVPIVATIHAVDRTVVVVLGRLRAAFGLDRPFCWSDGGTYRLGAAVEAPPTAQRDG